MSSLASRRCSAPANRCARRIESGQLHSLILWGPPGTGKTTLARLIAQRSGAEFIAMSAVMAGVKDVRAAVETARQVRAAGRRTVLFLDEVHRFNKAQQDTFLPFLEDGTLTFIGATTENPSFEVVSALLSRARVYVLKSLTASDLTDLMRRALSDPERGLGHEPLAIDDEALALLAAAADGDGRRALNMLEIAADLAPPAAGLRTIALAQAMEVAGGTRRRFDKGGEQFYDQISALHKCVRGTDPDAALYWLCRMLDGGCDPAYLARRITRMAVEDIGLADPRGLQMAMMPGTPTTASAAPKAIWRSPTQWSISPARPRATPSIPVSARPEPMSRNTARWMFRCASATRPRG